jgi:hypothetical protein
MQCVGKIGLLPKKLKTYLVEGIGENPKMVLIIVNSIGIPLVPSQNQLLATLKHHITWF